MNPEAKTHSTSSGQACQNCQRSFTIEPEDFAFYEKMQVPLPTFCPECRAQRRMCFWNERNLYRKKELREGKEVFSTYPEHAPIKIYEHDYWWSDAWDPMDYGRDYDFSKPFFEQFAALMRDVPRSSREIKTLVNSDYCDNSNNLKDCYLCFDASYCDDCLYGVQSSRSRNSMDIAFTAKAELCYEVFSVDSCFRTFFSVESSACRDSWFLRDCEDCSHCFGCVNLRHKQFHIFNVPYGKEAYEQKIKEFNLGSYEALSKMKAAAEDFWGKYPYRFTHGTRNTNVVGDYVYHSKNVYLSCEINDAVNMRYSQRQVGNSSDTYDATSWGDGCQLMYETVVCGENCKGLKFCMFCWPAARNMEYCASCHSSANLFGCVGLRKKEFCILNKQYTKEEYEALVPKIIEHMNAMPYLSEIRNPKHEIRKIEYRYGEFFPPELSPIAYNESVAADYFPLAHDEALRQGFAWRDPELREYRITIPSGSLPDHVADAEDSIVKEIIGCAECKRAYRILPQELALYRQWGIPLPRKCHNCRYRNRLTLRNPLRWYQRSCQCNAPRSAGVYANTAAHSHGENPCPNEFETSYAPERPEIIYCEECYNREVA